MPRCCTISHEFPNCCFYQLGRPPPSKTAFDLSNLSNFSPRPDFLHSQHDLSKGRKRLAPSMQENEIVVTKSCERALRSNPEDALLEVYEPSCGLCFGEVTITPFVILHARLSDEWPS